ncbi:MAG: hypothetical protein MUF18_13225 [Fimbriiglobus sp.]|nr:hypothetical protein [Fimbriiglobus sp.]
MLSRQIGIVTLAVLTLLAPLGCRRFQRRCDPPSDALTPRDRDRDTDPGVIPPRGSVIPGTDLPTTPAGPRRDTFTPTRPGPRLEAPIEPYSPFVTDNGPGGGWVLPPPMESRSKKLVEPFSPKPVAPTIPDEPAKPKKLLLIPEQMPDTPDKIRDAPEASSPLPKQEGGKPVPDRSVLQDPVAPDGKPPVPNALPRVEEEREPARRESKAVPKPETPPVGLSNFETVNGKVNVATGRKPTLDGYEWLAKNGYKTVVFAHDPAVSVSGARAGCEAAGLKFLAIPTSPETMSNATATFDAAVKDGSVYVCDDAGLRAATLWYAHFRRVDLTPPDAAKVRADRLGLGDTVTNPEQKKLWDAVQALLK